MIFDGSYSIYFTIKIERDQCVCFILQIKLSIMFENDVDDCNAKSITITTPYQIIPSKVIKGSKLTVR